MHFDDMNRTMDGKDETATTTTTVTVTETPDDAATGTATETGCGRGTGRTGRSGRKARGHCPTNTGLRLRRRARAGSAQEAVQADGTCADAAGPSDAGACANQAVQDGDGRDTRWGERGFTLIEVLGALVVGSLVFAFAAFAISGALESARVSGFNETLALMRMNIQEVYASSRGFGSSSDEGTDITATLVEAGAIPQNWLATSEDVDGSSTTTPIHNFGGTIAVEGSLTSFTITASGVTQSACRKIVSSQFRNWDEILVGDSSIDAIPTTMCVEDTGSAGNNTLSFTAH